MADPKSNSKTRVEEEEDDTTAHASGSSSTRHDDVSINVIDTNSTHTTTQHSKYPHRGAWVGTAAKMPEEEPAEGDSATITRQDVVNIFRHSITTSTVTQEEIARVKQMHDRIAEGVDFNFNYCSLLFIASVIAALGLASDSSTTVISSMLLSPIMGPVIGMSYGTVIWDIKLLHRSLRNEVVSLILCIIIGGLVSLCCCWTDLANYWPTDEMSIRGDLHTFLVALPVAFFSGLGVALSVLDEQSSSLVGVAISASLLPPAVNAGLIWVYVGMEHLGGVAATSDVTDADFVGMGGLSLALTVANIILVWTAGALMFRIKEVLPIQKKVFWDDLTIARRIYQRRAILEEEDDGTTADTMEQGLCISRTRTLSEE